ncbi:hypothetical protein [Micromonospora sp. NPDC023888]
MRIGLLVHLGTLLCEATGDLPGEAGHDRLSDRFVTWARVR